ncbi:AMP-binding protein [Nonomuraea sp. SMC257]|uniref:AMP-binding protein n=1 Tax=Nonomuraea montanisoli TaxID=2741721 RepID=A0A7Y6M5G6_9ACTN|nr:AMP-binding protein [Nonomuraea montanisoli]NUW34550.1 AMP-binding protein [Nonomuraea montanisoli]
MSTGTEELLHDLLDQAAARTPHRPAVSDDGLSWTFAELRDWSVRFARWLSLKGVRPGDRVVVRAPNSPYLAASVFGVSRVGAVFVPISPAVSAYQFGHIVKDADPALVLDEGHMHTPWTEFAASWAKAGPAPEGKATTGGHAKSLALLMYTSGSTAMPKGVACQHDQVLYAVKAIAERLSYTSTDVIFLALPMSFDYGLYQLFLSVVASAQLSIGTVGDTAGLLPGIRRSGATIVPVVPTLAVLLVRMAARRGVSGCRVRLFTNTGARLGTPLARQLRESFPGAAVTQMFGITECKRVSIGLPDEDLIREGSLGTALRGTIIRVLDDRGLPVKAGVEGQIAVVGPHVMRGYWRAPDLTNERFVKDPVSGERMLLTGDYGLLDLSGNLYFRGRRDDIFKRRGMRVSASEIEAAAEEVSGVARAALVREGERLYLAVTGSISPSALLEELTRRLEPAKRPDACVIVPELELTTNGKVDRAAVARRILSQSGASPVGDGHA